MNLADLFTIGSAVLALAFREQRKAAPAGGGSAGGGGGLVASDPRPEPPRQPPPPPPPVVEERPPGPPEPPPRNPLGDLRPTLITDPIIYGDDFVGPTELRERAPGKHWDFILIRSRP